jgi:hypothetical protein
VAGGLQQQDCLLFRGMACLFACFGVWTLDPTV